LNLRRWWFVQQTQVIANQRKRLISTESTWVWDGPVTSAIRARGQGWENWRRLLKGRELFVPRSFDVTKQSDHRGQPAKALCSPPVKGHRLISPCCSPRNASFTSSHRHSGAKPTASRSHGRRQFRRRPSGRRTMDSRMSLADRTVGGGYLSESKFPLQNGTFLPRRPAYAGPYVTPGADTGVQTDRG